MASVNRFSSVMPLVSNRYGSRSWTFDKARTPKESGQISKSYLEKQGFRIEDEGGSA